MLFIVALVTVLVWITDRFDDTVAYLREYVRRVHQSKLVSEDWRGTRPRIGTALRSTGLDVFLDEFRDSAARLKQDVLFLGPERLYAPPKDRADPRKASCFIVMPFSQEWSADVHRILARACEAAGVRPVRGDDLFSPTDILEDIWQSINAADFVIADITGRNPNVLYELGIAHTLAKPVLILSKEAADIPIDLATRRVILYGQKADAWREDLARMIQEAIAKVVEDYGLESRRSTGQIRGLNSQAAFANDSHVASAQDSMAPFNYTHVCSIAQIRNKRPRGFYPEDLSRLSPEIDRASVRNIFKPGEAFLLSLLVCAVQQLPKIFSLGE